MTQTIIQFKEIHKTFRRQKALSGLNMTVPEGVIYGLVGRNGAGKSTSLRMIMRLLEPDSGHLQVMGHHPYQLPLHLRQKIGYTSDSLPLIPWLKAGDLLRENASFYPDWDPDYVNRWVKKLELNLNKRIFSLSRGDRQKLGFLMAIGHRPRLLVLDEPAGGLDPVVRQQFLETLIEFLNETGSTIILSSHQLNELERIADHIGLLQNGTMTLETELETLRSHVRKVVLMGPQAETVMPDMGAVLDVQKHAGYAEIVYRHWHEDMARDLVQRFPEASLQVLPLDLESIFVHLQTQEV